MSLFASIEENDFELSQGWCNWARSNRPGPPLVMLHGVTRRWQTFLPLTPGIVARWQFHALDFRGHGQSSRRPGEYRVIHYVRDAVALLGRIDRPAVVYGHSLGAMVALAVAAQVPELVRAVVLEDPPFETMGRRLGSTSLHGYFAALQALAGERRSVGETAKSLANVELIDPLSGVKSRLGDLRDAAALRFAASCLSQLDREVLTPVLDGSWLQGFDLTAILGGVRCPALLLQADTAAGGMLTDADADLVESQLPDCTRVRLAGAGHLMHATRSQEVLNLVHNFVESLEQPAPASRIDEDMGSSAYEDG